MSSVDRWVDGEEVPVGDERLTRHPRSVRGLPRGRQRAASRVLDQLRMAIRNGLPPGHKFDELSLVTELGASRTAVREALQQLMRDGLVTRRPALGTTLQTTIHDVPLDLDQPDPRMVVTRVSRQQVACPPWIARQLELPTDVATCVRHVLSSLDGPLGVRAAYQSPLHAVGDADMGLGLRTVRTVVSGARAGAALAAVLQLDPDDGVLVRERLLVDAEGASRQVAFSHFRGDRVAFTTGTTL